MVNKKAPLLCPQATGPASLETNGFACGPIVQEEEPPSLQFRKEDPHLLRILHQSGSHVVAHPFDVRHCLYIFRELAKERLFIHLLKEGPLPGFHFWIVVGFHGEMEDDLPAPLVSLLGKLFRIRGEWQDGEGQRKIQIEELLRKAVFSPEIVDHNGDLRSKASLKRWRLGVKKRELMGDSILNLYF